MRLTLDIPSGFYWLRTDSKQIDGTTSKGFPEIVRITDPLPYRRKQARLVVGFQWSGPLESLVKQEGVDLWVISGPIDCPL